MSNYPVDLEEDEKRELFNEWKREMKGLLDEPEEEDEQ